MLGGEKFVKCGIFFKFSRDLYGIYGGDAYSIKAASHEIKSTMAVSDCRIPNIFTPLMALIRYSFPGISSLGNVKISWARYSCTIYFTHIGYYAMLWFVGWWKDSGQDERRTERKD